MTCRLKAACEKDSNLRRYAVVRQCLTCQAATFFRFQLRQTHKETSAGLPDGVLVHEPHVRAPTLHANGVVGWASVEQMSEPSTGRGVPDAEQVCGDSGVVVVRLPTLMDFAQQISHHFAKRPEVLLTLLHRLRPEWKSKTSAIDRCCWCMCYWHACTASALVGNISWGCWGTALPAETACTGEVGC